MNTPSPKTDRLSAFKRFFTLKTDGQILDEELATRARARKLAAPHGLRGFIQQEQQKIDRLTETTDQFLADIEWHFGQYDKYLAPTYNGQTKYENVDKGFERRFAIKWIRRNFPHGDLAVFIAFVYTETKTDGIRVDYVYDLGDHNEQVINDNYDGDNDIYKLQSRVSDRFRSVRRFTNHTDFMATGKLPDWFKTELDTHIKPI